MASVLGKKTFKVEKYQQNLQTKKFKRKLDSQNFCAPNPKIKIKVSGKFSSQ